MTIHKIFIFSPLVLFVVYRLLPLAFPVFYLLSSAYRLLPFAFCLSPLAYRLLSQAQYGDDFLLCQVLKSEPFEQVIK